MYKHKPTIGCVCRRHNIWLTVLDRTQFLSDNTVGRFRIGRAEVRSIDMSHCTADILHIRGSGHVVQDESSRGWFCSLCDKHCAGLHWREVRV